MIDIPKVGDEIWTLEQTIESQDCYESEKRRPNLVKVTRVKGDLISASHFNEETGETDDDSNASYYLRPNECYSTRLEALREYLKSRDGVETSLKDQLADLARDRVEAALAIQREESDANG